MNLNKEDLDRLSIPSSLYKNTIRSLIETMTAYKDMQEDIIDALCIYAQYERMDAMYKFYKEQEERKNGKG